MTRRKVVTATLASGVAAAWPASGAAQPIELYVELDVDPARENLMVENFRKVFRPTISKQPGFVGVRLLKMRQAMKGSAPATPYRLVISFQTEEQRVKWVATDDHQRAWPTIESCLRGEKYTAVLYDMV